MAQAVNSYDKLYNNMKQRFSVSIEDEKYTLGEYILMKADGRRAEDALPVAANTAEVVKNEPEVANFVSYVTNKLQTKPAKERSMKKFPFRATASAFLTAAVACAFIFSFTLIGSKSLDTDPTVASEVSSAEQLPEDALNFAH